MQLGGRGIAHDSGGGYRKINDLIQHECARTCTVAHTHGTHGTTPEHIKRPGTPSLVKSYRLLVRKYNVFLSLRTLTLFTEWTRELITCTGMYPASVPTDAM